LNLTANGIASMYYTKPTLYVSRCKKYTLYAYIRFI